MKEELNEPEAGAVIFSAWNVENDKDHKLFDVIKKGATGRPVGHATLQLELPVNEHTTALVEQYCQKDSSGAEQLIPHLVTCKYSEEGPKFFYLIDFSWWPSSSNSSKRTMRTHDDDRILEAGPDLAEPFSIPSVPQTAFIPTFSSLLKNIMPLILPTTEKMLIPSTMVHDFQVIEMQKKVNQMEVLKGCLEGEIKSIIEMENPDEMKLQLLELLRKELKIVNKAFTDLDKSVERQIVVGLPPDVEMPFSIKNSTNEYGFDLEKMLSRAREYVEKSAYTVLCNCSATAYEVLKAGSSSDLRHCFDTSIKNLSSVVITPQNLYKMMCRYQENISDLRVRSSSLKGSNT